MISAYPALAQRQRFCAAARTLRALARRCLLYQPPRILFFLCSLLDGCSRSIVHWELREAMTEADVEIILQRGLEK